MQLQCKRKGRRMTTDSAVRICENCVSEIPKWKAKGTRFCSAKCKFETKETKRLTKRNTGSLLHACLSTVFDPAKPCDCKMRLSDDQAKRMFAKGEAVKFQSRNSEFIESAALLVTGTSLKFPRAATVEQPHIERLTDHHKESDDKSLDDLRKAIEENQALRGQEEIVRLQIYGELTAALRRKWIVEISPDEYDKAESEAEGRSLFWFSDERTPGGIGRDVDPRTLAPLAPIEIKYQEEIEVVENVAVEATESDSETENESSEIDDADKDESDAISLDDVIE